MKKLFFFCVLIAGLTIASCSDDDPVKSSDKQLLSFEVEGTQATISENNKTVTLSFSSVIDLTALAPEISISDKASVSPASGEVKDFSSPVKYTVTAEDGTTAIYTVAITCVDITAYIPSLISSADYTCGDEVMLSIDNTAELPTGVSYRWYQDGVELTTTDVEHYPVSKKGEYSVIVIAGPQQSQESNKKQLDNKLPKPTIELACIDGKPTLTIKDLDKYPFSIGDPELSFLWLQTNEEGLGYEGGIDPIEVLSDPLDFTHYQVWIFYKNCGALSDVFAVRQLPICN